MVNLTTAIGDVVLANPVMPASGTIAVNLAAMTDVSRLGALVLKTITPDIRQGVKPPRVVEYGDGTLFSIGIPSQGPEYLLQHTLPAFSRFGPPIVVSISADRAEDFGQLAAQLSVSRVSAIEANISCPNLRAHGKAFGMEAQATYDVVKAMKTWGDKPIWAKLTPNVGNIIEIAQAAEEAGADAVVVGNAILGMGVDAEAMRPRLGNVIGGLTGPAIKPIMLRMTNQCASSLSIPVIGCGGICNGEDVVEYLLAGATAVQMGTINFVHPDAMVSSIDWLADYCERHGLAQSALLTGAMADAYDARPPLKRLAK